MSQRPASSEVDRQLASLHRRLVKAMDGRMDEMDEERKERYFAVLSMLVTKLETPSKPLRQILQEMMTDAMSLVLQEMQS